MAKRIHLAAEARERAGKGAARAIRREKKVPAVIYGDKKEPVKITLPGKEVTAEYFNGHFFTSLSEVSVDGDKYLVLARDVQVDPVSDHILHVDFLRVTPKTQISVNVPVHFINEEAAPGIEDEGGVLNTVRYEVEVVCRATDIPDYIEVDLTGFNVGDTINISHATMPDGAESAIQDRDFTLATIVVPRSIAEEEAEEAEAEEEAEGEEGEAAAEGEDGEGGEEEAGEDTSGEDADKSE